MKKYIIPKLKLERLDISNIAAGSPPIKDEDADDSPIYSKENYWLDDEEDSE
jgi:hypothetical protein